MLEGTQRIESWTRIERGVGGPDARYSGRFDRLGVTIGVWGTFVSRPGEVLLLEAEGPETFGAAG